MTTDATEEGTGRVLIIEDDATQRLLLADMLERSGYPSDIAGSCAEGRECFERGKYACVLVDLGLPDGSGHSLIKEFAAVDPEVVAVVLTGDASAGSVIDTLRAGAFDYLTKPADSTTLRAALARAMQHHAVCRERADLLDLLLEERELLRARVDEATADIRQYAGACERSNARLRALLDLTRLSSGYLTEEELLHRAFENLHRQTPLRALVLCDVGRQKLAAVVRKGDDEPAFLTSDSAFNAGSYDPLVAEVEPEQVLTNWLDRSLGVDTTAFNAYISTQSFQDRATCTVGFYMEPAEGDESALHEFLEMCAYFLAFEWEQGKLLLHVAHNVSLGNIAVELARNFIQPLTAIRTSADLVTEFAVSPEVAEGMEVVTENVERLRRQMQEFQKLTLFREDSVETVRLVEYVEQALQMLAVAIRNRSVLIERDFQSECECVLLNGAVLARTFLDLLLGSLRAVDMGGTIALSLREVGNDYCAFEVRHKGSPSDSLAVPGGAVTLTNARDHGSHPGLQLVERAVHSCGGTLNVEEGADGLMSLRVLLPRNATTITSKMRTGIGR
ncbi:MAG: response regulator [bacterium]|nr:response regulator [bacterium]